LLGRLLFCSTSQRRNSASRALRPPGRLSSMPLDTDVATLIVLTTRMPFVSRG
jgi:hypothetical protein